MWNHLSKSYFIYLMINFAIWLYSRMLDSIKPTCLLISIYWQNNFTLPSNTMWTSFAFSYGQIDSFLVSDRSVLPFLGLLFTRTVKSFIPTCFSLFQHETCQLRTDTKQMFSSVNVWQERIWIFNLERFFCVLKMLHLACNKITELDFLFLLLILCKRSS